MLLIIFTIFIVIIIIICVILFKISGCTLSDIKTSEEPFNTFIACLFTGFVKPSSYKRRL